MFRIEKWTHLGMGWDVLKNLYHPTAGPTNKTFERHLAAPFTVALLGARLAVVAGQHTGKRSDITHALNKRWHPPTTKKFAFCGPSKGRWNRFSHDTWGQNVIFPHNSGFTRISWTFLDSEYVNSCAILFKYYSFQGKSMWISSLLKKKNSN